VTNPTNRADEDFLGKALGRFNAYVSTLPASGSRRALFDWRMLVAAEPICASLPLLKAWARGLGTHFNLVDPWCYDIALCTLLQYRLTNCSTCPKASGPPGLFSAYRQYSLSPETDPTEADRARRPRLARRAPDLATG